MKTKNRSYPDLPSLSESTFEFQARDKFWRLTRGRVRARSKSEAKKLVKERGLWWPLSVWLQGTESWESIRSWTAPMGTGTYDLDSLELKHKDYDTITYGDRNSIRFIFGSILCLAGIGLSSIFFYPYSFKGKAFIDSSAHVYCLLGGIALLAVGCVIFLHRFELYVERRERRIVIRACIMPFGWRSELIDARHAEKVVLQQEIFYGVNGEGLNAIRYVIMIFIDGKDIQLDASCSRKAEFALGQDIAECLNIPFVCNEDGTTWGWDK